MANKNNNQPRDHSIEVSDLTFAYAGATTPTIQDIQFRVPRGTIFGLLGSSGAGKSTVQRILTRQIRRIDKGTVTILGRDSNAWDHTLYERVGVGFELPNHYPKLTALENLKLFASLYSVPTQNPAHLLEMVGLEGVADKRASELSKGMQVRLNFARALLHSPELLFLDEPTTGLDPTTAKNLRTLIADLRAQGTTIILTTHNMHDAELLCDQVGFLANGKMVTIDSPEALKIQHGERSVEVVLDDIGTLVSQNFPLKNLGDNPEFLEFIKGRTIHTIHSQEASLDAVFQIVTGQTLESAAQG